MKRLGLGVVAVLVLLTVAGSPAGVVATTAPECVTANADGSFTVPLDWELKPPDMGAGEQFRLLFITSRQRNAAGFDIGTYNSFVQDTAKLGHPAISNGCATQFKVVGSTSGANARSNTGTTGTGVPIYWLQGNRLADDYADFYDGAWDDYGMTEEHGRRVSYTEVLTGSEDDGTVDWNYRLSTSHRDGRYVDEQVRTGDPSGAGSPLSSGLAFQEAVGRFYALSPVFAVEKHTIGFGEAAVTVDEGRMVVQLAVVLSQPRSEATSFTVATTDGTAGANGDYRPGPHGGSIPAGQTQGTVSIGIVDDAVAEGVERFSAQLTGTGLPDDVAPREGATELTVTIVDNDGSGRLVLTPSSPLRLTEGGSGAYTVELASAPAHDVTVEVRSDDPDVTANPETLTFTAGNWSAAQTVTVTQKPDYDIWDDTATLTHTTRSDDPDYDGSASTAVKQVEVPDSVIAFYPPTISFRDAEITVDEFNEGEVRVNLVLSSYSIATVGVTITATSGAGTATAGEDFRSVSHRATIYGGYTEGTAYIQQLVLDDTELEEHETFTLTLSDPSRATLGEQSTMTVIIADDEFEVSRATEAQQTEVNEGDGHAVVSFNLSRALRRNTRVNIEYEGFGAEPYRDFRPSPRRITVPAGQTEVHLRIPIIDDDVPERSGVSELFLVTVAPEDVPDGGTRSFRYFVTITDDDDNAVEVSPAPTLFEGQTRTLTVRNIPPTFGIGLLNEHDFYFITTNSAYPFTTTTHRNPDQRCADWGDYNAEGVDICIKDAHWNRDEGVASIRLTALRDREWEGDEYVYMRIGTRNFSTLSHVFRITVTDHPAEYHEFNPRGRDFFWCETLPPAVADVFPGIPYQDLTEAEKMEYFEAVGDTWQVAPPPPVLVAEWDRDGYEAGETATIRFRAQDEDGNPRRSCGGVKIEYRIYSQPAETGERPPLFIHPPDRQPLRREHTRQVTIGNGDSEAAVSFPLQDAAAGTVSFHIIGATAARGAPVPALRDGDGAVLRSGEEGPPADRVTATVTCPAPCASGGEVPPPEVSIGGGSGGEEGNPVSFQLLADPAPPDGERVDVSVTVTAEGDFGVQTGTRTVTIGSGGAAFLDLPTTDDDVDEADGSVTLTINPGAGYTIGGLAPSLTAPVLDDDAPALESTPENQETQPPEPPLVRYADLVQSFYDRITANHQHGDGASGAWNKRFLKAMRHAEYVNYPQAAATVADAQRIYDHISPGGSTAWDGTVEALTYAYAYYANTDTTD